MSKISINVNTENGDVDVNVDGKSVEGSISRVSLYRYEYPTLNHKGVEAGVEAVIELRSEEFAGNLRKLVTLVTASSHAASQKKGKVKEQIGDVLIIEEPVSGSKNKFWE